MDTDRMNTTADQVILGLNAFHGDAAAALVVDGRVAAAVAEERLNRVKHSAGFPASAIREVLAIAGLAPDDIDAIAVGRNPRAHLARKAIHVARRRPSVRRAIVPRLRSRKALRGIPELVATALDIETNRVASIPVIEVEHHLAHAASAFLGSPFERAAIVTTDGFGDFVSTAWGTGSGHSVALHDRVFFPHSLGVLYQAATQFIGFPYYGDEGKLMGLSPLGEPRFMAEFEKMVRLKPGGQFQLVTRYFSHVKDGVNTAWTDEKPEIGSLYTDAWTDLFGPPRQPNQPRTQRDADIAMSVQTMLERVLFHILDHVHRRTGLDDLCLAGGVALNCVFNGKIQAQSPFARSWVFPAAGDDGLAIGAAWHAWSQAAGQRPEPVAVPLWGAHFDQGTIDQVLATASVPDDIDVQTFESDELFGHVADLLDSGAIVGWFNGRVEFGPRALGSRSILTSPAGDDTKDRLNARIKHREAFRPFAPAILLSEMSEWFETTLESPAMLHALQVRAEKRERIPAVTHVDGSGRVQTVDPATHPDFARLIQAFFERSGIPILLNTSFNENEPIVYTPQQALDCFLRTDMDVLVLGRTVLRRQRR